MYWSIETRNVNLTESTQDELSRRTITRITRSIRAMVLFFSNFCTQTSCLIYNNRCHYQDKHLKFSIILLFYHIQLAVCKDRWSGDKYKLKKTPVAKWIWTHLHNGRPKDRCSWFSMFCSTENRCRWLKSWIDRKEEEPFTFWTVVRGIWRFILTETGMQLFFVIVLHKCMHIRVAIS